MMDRSAPDQYRPLTIIAAGLLVSVVFYVILVEALSRLAVLRPPFPGNQTLGVVALAASVPPLIVAAVVRRRLSSAGGQSPPVVATSCVISWALAEVPAILGLVAFLLTGLREAAYGPIAFSLGAHALLFPRRPQWEAWTRPSSGTPAPSPSSG